MVKEEIRHFSQLIVWQKSNDLVIKIYQLTKNFPKDEMFGLTSQIRRAAVSITCNIAEGWGRFHYKEKIRFYYIARGSNTEVQNLLMLSRKLDYLSEQDYVELKILVYEGYKLLNGLIKSIGNLSA
jgi:four helix bundle protein